ncbi:MAG TPA: GxxExxY protein [Tepidisphaeraceae bacterium]|jgi:GxxExxY protein|nr:GxxExxY protein [Tepidisphaeraceae bacterium]
MNIYDFRERGTSGVPDDVEDLAQQVIGAAIEVHRIVGPGQQESVYKLSMAHELTLRSIPYEIEAPIGIVYKGKLVGEGRIDILIAGRLVLELKAVATFVPAHTGQVIAYLQAKQLKLGLLMNFNVPMMRNGIKRVINNYL